MRFRIRFSNRTRSFHRYAQFGKVERSEQRGLAPYATYDREEFRSSFEDTFRGAGLTDRDGLVASAE